MDIACEESRGAICGYNTTGEIEFINDLGSWEILPNPVWSQMDPANAQAGCKLTYNNGLFLDREDMVTVTVEFPCDSTNSIVSQDFAVSETHLMDSFVFTMTPSSFACPNARIVPVIAPTSISFGSTLLAVFFVSGFFYLVIGTLYKTMNLGTTGVESIPNIEVT